MSRLALATVVSLALLAGVASASSGSDANSPSWSPDGQWIVFDYGDYVKEVRPDGQGIRHILYVTSKKGENFAPDWGSYPRSSIE